MATGLLIAGIVAALSLAKKKGVNGVGAVSKEAIDWGANELYLWVLNTEWMYRKAVDYIRKWNSLGFDQQTKIRRMSWFLQHSVAPYIHKNKGMSFGEQARKKAAIDILSALEEDI